MPGAHPLHYKYSSIVLDLDELDDAELGFVAVARLHLGQRAHADDLDQDDGGLGHAMLLQERLPSIFQLGLDGHRMGWHAYPETPVVVRLILEAPEACHLGTPLQVPAQGVRAEGLDGSQHHELRVATIRLHKQPLLGRRRLLRLLALPRGGCIRDVRRNPHLTVVVVVHVLRVHRAHHSPHAVTAAVGRTEPAASDGEWGRDGGRARAA
mmetsp:Transcript_137133/g.438511  ORF Transcript_137133/g.438511 Transcript_137133/m.438511 type:complete len:210 (+) Transcript_137133:49-678(+)